MKKSFILLLCVSFLAGFSSCKGKEKPEEEQIERVEINPDAIGAGKIDQNDTLSGKKVEEMYPDNQSKIVGFYKIDENGQLTDDKYREVYYYEATHYKYIEGDLDVNRRTGPWYAYHKNGNLCTEAFYVDGKEQGMYKVYHDNGYLYYAGEYKDGKRVGVWKFYDETGLLEKTENYDEQNQYK